MIVEQEEKGPHSILTRSGMWIRRHPLWTIFITCLVLALTDLACLPVATLISYREGEPFRTAFQKADIERQTREGKEPQIRKVWVPYSRFPPHLVRAVLVSEDALFWQHSGFDTFEIRRSIQDAVSDGKDLRGASTITQQLVKNLFFSSSRDPLRKLNESILTIVAERMLGKRRILELYLNEIEWGSGVYGAGAAALYHFRVPVEALSEDEAAFLAAIIPMPTRYSPTTMTPYLSRRIATIRERMGPGKQEPDTTVGRRYGPAESPIDTSVVDTLSGRTE